MDETGRLRQIAAMSAISDSALETVSTSNIGVACSLSWHQINVSVPLKKGKGTPADVEKGHVLKKAILRDVSGYVEPGEILFVMGPSGSGKTTLLDVLADRVKLPCDGTQFLNGAPKSPAFIRRNAKYVLQNDDLLGTLTIQETLEFAASLYVSQPRERAGVVARVISMLGLEGHVNTKIGNDFMRGLSGGQIRRVSIGFELIASPKLLFLDEPLSGLDSATAFKIMSELRYIAKKSGMSMIMSVHQPSELVFEMADSLLLLTEGRTCFFGAAQDAAQYFKSLGFVRPNRYSDIEWMLDLINRDFGNNNAVDKCINTWPRSQFGRNLELILDERASQTSSKSAQRATARQSGGGFYAVSFWQQTRALVHRGILNMLRNPFVVWLRLFTYSSLSVFVGMIFLRLGTEQKDIALTTNALLFVCAFVVFMSLSVFPAYSEERAIFLRERANGGYSVAAYIFSHTLYEIPYVSLLSITVAVICYWMVGLRSSAGAFFIFTANLFSTLFVAESVVVLIAAIVPVLILGIVTTATFFGLYVGVMGAFVAVNDLGWWIRWAHYISLHYYAFSTFMVNQFRGTTYGNTPGNSVYAAMDLEERIWLNFVVQIVMVMVYRAAAAAWLHFITRGRR